MTMMDRASCWPMAAIWGLARQRSAAPVCAGPVSGTACAGCTVEIFSDDNEEGRVYETSVLADGSGNFTWSGSPNGPNVTATSTHPAGHTSPFSALVTIGTCNTAPTAAFSVSPGSGTTSTVFTFDASSSSDTEDPTSALSFRWDWENNGIYDTPWSTSATHHTFLHRKRHPHRAPGGAGHGWFDGYNHAAGGSVFRIHPTTAAWQHESVPAVSDELRLSIKFRKEII